MPAFVLVVFALVYLGMLLGGLPGLKIDRTGVAMLGALALVAGGALTPGAAWNAIDVPTIALLFGLMTISVQLELTGFYAHVAERLAASEISPRALLALLVLTAGALSAVLTNDVVCLAFPPLLVRGCFRRGLDPLPYLLGLACAANVGSAATLIGNPQNMLVGQSLTLSFTRYLALAIVPTILGLVATWAIVSWSVRGRWRLDRKPIELAAPVYDAASASKALVLAGLLFVLFLFTDWPREVLALGAAGILLLSRRTSSRTLIARIDGQLLLLFMGLFVVNHAFQASGWAERGFTALREFGVDPSKPAVLFLVCVLLSNLVSNVPTMMLLLPLAKAAVPGPEVAGPILALSSTLAGNLLLVGSIANLIVAQAAKEQGIEFGWRQHARVGIPVTLVTLALAAAWLWLVV